MDAAKPVQPLHRALLDDVGQLRMFVAVVETQSFSAAARRLGLTPPTISRQIGGLEEKLNARLVSRTTRRLHVTELGQRFYEHCHRVIEELEAAEAEVSETTREPQGTLRITAPTVLAVHHLSPALPEYMARYPKIAVELVLTSHKLDLFNEGVDLAIRITEAIDPGLVAIKLAPNRRVFAAAPAYLAARGTPLAPEDLQHHNCLVARGSTVATWPVKGESGIQQLKVHGRLMADNGQLLHDAAVGGLGIAMLPTFLAHAALKQGLLVPILEDYVVQNTWIFAVLPHRRYVAPKTRSFIDLMKARFGPVPYWDR